MKILSGFLHSATKVSKVIAGLLSLSWLVLLLLLMVFTVIMYGSIFSDLKKSTGNFLSYYVIISLLIGIFFTTRELIKAIKNYKRKKDK